MNTDAEKIARMVEWLGGWPPCNEIGLIEDYWVNCSRCGPVEHGGACFKWNPFERIEDAWMLVNRFRTSEAITELSLLNQLYRIVGNPMFLAEPARAIAEAAWHVIEKLEVSK